MGAEIIKIEPPSGDPWRYALEIIPGVPGFGRSFFALNRGKKGITLDLKNEKSQLVVKKLIEESDVMIINSRPDVPKKLKLDYEKIKSYNPKIIYCSNTAFGRSGPDSHRPGYDLIAQAISGLMSAENKTLNEVPQPIQSYIVARAAAVFCSRVLGDPNQYQILIQKEAFAKSTALEYECNQGDYSFFGSPKGGNFYKSYQPFHTLQR